MTVLVHPTANAFNRALAEALEREQRLVAFHTTIARGRRSVAVHRSRVVEHPFPELARIVLERLGFRRLAGNSASPFSIDAVYRRLDSSVSRKLGSARSVYAYEDGALACFRVAQQLGKARVYELPIAYFETVQRLLREEAERHPGWTQTLGAVCDSQSKLARKAEEISLADIVICPSHFVQRSLPPGTGSIVAPFGSPQIGEMPGERRGPLRILFAGALSQRKGLADVFAAMRLLGRRGIELIVMGSLRAPMRFYQAQWKDFIYEPPRSHNDVLALMSTCDAMVLPSIVEGRALVQQEALSRGLPIIVTANAGGEDLIEEGRTGFLVPIRSPEAIADRIEWLATHREQIPAMRIAAQEKAASITWCNYTTAILNAITAAEEIYA